MPDDEITAEFDSASLTSGWDHAPVVGRVARLRWAARTDIGKVRDNNEDKFDVFEPEDPVLLATRGRLFAVADGMGGHAAGQVASEFALKCLVRTYFHRASHEPPAVALQQAFLDSNRLIVQAALGNPAWSGMGTTLVVAVVRGDQLIVAHAGDSRALLLRRGKAPEWLTTDHSWVEEQVRSGALTREQAESSARRNVITRCIGMDGMPGAELRTLGLEAGDTVVLASDGVTNLLDADAIAGLVAGSGLSQAALSLIDLANDRGGTDNGTVLLIRCDGFDPVPDAAGAHGS